MGEWRYLSVWPPNHVEYRVLTVLSYLVQQYDKDYKLWARDLKTQMEMAAWVIEFQAVGG
jgi:hypothetical protein